MASQNTGIKLKVIFEEHFSSTKTEYGEDDYGYYLSTTDRSNRKTIKEEVISGKTAKEIFAMEDGDGDGDESGSSSWNKRILLITTMKGEVLYDSEELFDNKLRKIIERKEQYIEKLKTLFPNNYFLEYEQKNLAYLEAEDRKLYDYEKDRAEREINSYLGIEAEQIGATQ